jgi:hypothetical protein
MNGPEAFAMLAFVGFAGSTVFILARAVARRIESKAQRPPAVPGDVAMRMERMERTLDSVAIEIERISENQRFLTKVLAERERSSLPPGVIRE